VTVKPTPSNRRDARSNRQAILDVSVSLIRQDPDVTLDEIAHAAGVSRATVHRHFKTRSNLLDATHEHGKAVAEADTSEGLRPAGELSSSGPVVFDISEVLTKVPPHLLGEQIVAEAQRLAGMRSVALYLVDIDGTRLRRLAGSQEFPEEIPVPLAVGPEIPREGLPALKDALEEALPASVMAPMMLRGRAIGILLAVDAPEGPLRELARQAAAAITLAESYTDVFDATRRRRDISAASEIQQNLLPPRIARISGGLLAGNVLPGYDIGGDWFDYVENPDGAWIAVADANGSGTAAAAIGAVTLGAFRAKRRRQAPLEETVNYMEDVLEELPYEAICNVIVGRWHGPTGSFFWVGCGAGVPYLVTRGRTVEPLPGDTYPSLGRRDDDREVKAHGHRLNDDEFIVMVSDGVLERKHRDGGTLGIEIIASVIADLPILSAPAITRELERQIVAASEDHLEDDATIVVFEPTTAN
jgi:serine phosphatase RsbU (regulator of sigma subunit)